MELVYVVGGETLRLPVEYADANMIREDLEFENGEDFLFEISNGGRYFPTLTIPSEFSKRSLVKHALFGYAHGGVSLHTESTCPWDSWQIGHFYVPRNTPIADIQKKLNVITNLLNNNIYTINVDDTLYVHNPAYPLLDFVKDFVNPNATSADICAD